MSAFDFGRPIDRRGSGSSKWSRYPDDVLPMWVADMDFAVAPEIVAAVEDRLRHPVLGYGVARAELRERIVADMQEKYGWTISPDHIVFLPGVEPGFNMALRAMLAPGDGVLVQTPIYRPILNAPGHWDMKRIDVELHLGDDGRYATDAGVMAAAFRRARAMLLCNPHNPTGKVYDHAELTALAEMCVAADIFIISDEIHCDLLFDRRRHVPIASLAPEIADRTVTLMSASKTYNIAGLKTAFAIIPNATIRDKFIASKLGMVDSVNVLGLEATLAAYCKAGLWKDTLIGYLKANRDYLAEALPNRLPSVRMATPEGTFLAWLDCSQLNFPTDPYAFFLTEARVGLSAGTDFGAACGNFIRLNFGCSRATLEEGLSRMEGALKRKQLVGS